MGQVLLRSISSGIPVPGGPHVGTGCISGLGFVLGVHSDGCLMSCVGGVGSGSRPGGTLGQSFRSVAAQVGPDVSQVCSRFKGGVLPATAVHPARSATSGSRFDLWRSQHCQPL